jgi:hypothetical protein
VLVGGLCVEDGRFGVGEGWRVVEGLGVGPDIEVLGCGIGLDVLGLGAGGGRDGLGGDVPPRVGVLT